MKCLVSYYWNKGNVSGYGDTYTENPMTTKEGIEFVVAYIEKNQGFDGVVIINIRNLAL